MADSLVLLSVYSVMGWTVLEVEAAVSPASAHAAAAAAVGNTFPAPDPHASGVLFPRVSAVRVPRSADEDTPLFRTWENTTQTDRHSLLRSFMNKIPSSRNKQYT